MCPERNTIRIVRGPATRRTGFSLIELLVASVAAGILALTASTLLVLAWKSWATLREGIEMQRDAAVAFTTIKHQLRGATPGDVTATNGLVQIHTADADLSFYQQGSDLIFDPDIAVASNERTVIEGRVNAFAPISNSWAGRTTLTIELSLFGDIGHETTSLTTTVSLRN